MKRIFLTMMLATCISLVALAQVRVETRIDSANNKRIEIEVLDTVRNGKAEVDTLSITTSPLDSQSRVVKSGPSSWDWDDDEDEEFNKTLAYLGSSGVIAIIFIVVFGIFVCPFLIVAVILNFRHKNRKAKYELAVRMIEKGEPLPADLEDTVRGVSNMESRGIRNICIGAALCIFLWALTDSLGLGCIGLLVLANGVSQYVVSHRTKEKVNDNEIKQLKEELQRMKQQQKPEDGQETIKSEEV